jgi:DNA-directed RNA polymerase specialized sigma24 family protein
MNRTISAQYLGSADEFQRLVMHAFSLPSVLRKVFLLCEVRGLSVEQAARILGISAAAATDKLDEARREMRERMQVDSFLM